MTRIRTPERSARPAGSPRPAPRSAARPAAAPTPRRSFNLSLPTLTFGPRAQKATLILLAGAALAFVIVALTPPLVMAALSIAGLGAPLWLGLALLLAAAVRWSGWEALDFPWNRWLGVGVLLIEVQALLAMMQPAWEFNHVRFDEVTLGGLVGSVLLGQPGPLAVAKTSVLAVLAFILIAPGAALRIADWSRWATARGTVRTWRLTVLGVIQWRRMAVTIYRRRMVPRAVMGVVRPIVAAMQGVWTRFAVSAPDLTDADDFLPSASPAEGAAPLMRMPGDLDVAPPPGAPERAREPKKAPERPLDIQTAGEDAAEMIAPAPAGRWEVPPAELLDAPPPEVVQDTGERARQLEAALASYGVQASVVSAQVGPAVTQFGVEPGWTVKYREVKERDEYGRIKVDKDGVQMAHQEEISRVRVRVEKITGLSNDLALALAAPSVRIEAPVPGKAVVGIEVPNPTPSVVALRAILESPIYTRLRARSKLAIGLGKGVSGEPVAADLTRMPHLLIAGSTGSGKSVCINTIICSLLMQASPDEVRLLMVDPKRVELVPYNDVPHLLAPVIVDAEKVVGLLYFVLKEMDNRYKAFAEIGVRNIEGYNKSAKAGEPLPYWVVIIDELADLMMVAPYEVEKSLCRLAQLARATGIHLVVATQRPSVDVVTGLIKANFPSRIAFAVTSQIDSRTILDSAGAEKLLGRGDMLFQPIDASKPRRVQGTFVSDEEVERVVEFWSHDRWLGIKPQQYTSAIEEMNAAASEGKESAKDKGGPDELLERARMIAAESGKVSASMLQRKLRIGYVRASRLVDALKEEGDFDEDDE